MYNEVSISQAKKVIEIHLRRLLRGAKADDIVPVFLHGSPGCGKSAIVHQCAEEAGVGLVDLRLTQMDSVDLRGMPQVRDNKTHWVPSGELPQSGQGILFLDELNAAPRAVQVAAYQLLLDRALGEYHVPDGWLIVAAGNLSTDKAAASVLPSALANRFLHINVRVNSDDFRKYGLKTGLDPVVLAYLSWKPAALLNMDGNVGHGFPTPRSWERVSQLLQYSEEYGAEVFEALISGLIGEGAAVEFLAFRKTDADFPAVKSMLLGLQKPEIPERADMRHVLVTSMVHIMLHCSTEEFSDLLEGFFRVSIQLSSDFAALAMIDLLVDSGLSADLVTKVFSHPDWQQWNEVHGQAFRYQKGIQRGTNDQAA